MTCRRHELLVTVQTAQVNEGGEKIVMNCHQTRSRPEKISCISIVAHGIIAADEIGQKARQREFVSIDDKVYSLF